MDSTQTRQISFLGRGGNCGTQFAARSRPLYRGCDNQTETLSLFRNDPMNIVAVIKPVLTPTVKRAGSDVPLDSEVHAGAVEWHWNTDHQFCEQLAVIFCKFCGRPLCPIKVVVRLLFVVEVATTSGALLLEPITSMNFVDTIPRATEPT